MVQLYQCGVAMLDLLSYFVVAIVLGAFLASVFGGFGVCLFLELKDRRHRAAKTHSLLPS